MDPYRLGAKNDKMAGLIDFESAFRRDVCLIEWPDRMPYSVMRMAGAGLSVAVSGMGAQAAGRLITVTPLAPPPPPPKAKGGKGGQGQGQGQGAGGQKVGVQEQAAEGSGSAKEAAAAAAAVAAEPGAASNAEFAAKLAAWRRAFPASLPAVDMAWREAATGGGGGGGDGSLDGALRRGAAGGGSGGTTINPRVAAALAAGEAGRREWLVLGIESSCDDTAAAVVRGDGTVLAHQVASQTGLHEQYGGVKPDVARQAHADAIQGTVDACLAAAGVSPADLTAVAVTSGPGLALCLQVGVRHGLGLAVRHGLPLVAVHHMEAHALMTRLPSVNEQPMQFPSLLLLVSGGHNMLVLCQGVGRHRILGTTLDDSAGECFDKIARMAGITAIPGGPHLERLAASGRPDAHTRYPLTIPLANGAQKDSCNFSFSGLKTQVATLLAAKRKELQLPDLPLPPALAAAAAAAEVAAAPQQDGDGAAGSTAAAAAGAAAAEGQQGEQGAVAVQEQKQEQEQVDTAEAARLAAAEAEFQAAAADIAASFQRTAVRFLQQRTRRALQWLRDDAAQEGPGGAGFVRALVVAGGVAANAAVRRGLGEVAAEFGLPCVYPPVKYCTDNGLMVAWTGVERLALGLYSAPPRAPVGGAEGPEAEAELDRHVQVIPRWPMGPMDPRSTANKGRAHIKQLH